MAKGKRYAKAASAVDRSKFLTLDEAMAIVARGSGAKFDETVELALRLGVDPRHADQNVRGTVSLPFELGEHKRVAVKIIDDRGIESLKVVQIQ